MYGHKPRSAWFGLIIHLLGISCMVIAMILPEWLRNPPLTNTYPWARRWGLFGVIGQVTRTHKQTMEAACEAQGQQSMGVSCSGGLCSFLAAKCTAWRLMMITSYVTAAAISLGLVFSCISLAISPREKLSIMRFTVGFAWLSVFMVVAAMAQYIVVCQMVFVMVNTTSGYYPVPHLAASWYIACLGAFFLLVAALDYSVRFARRRREKGFIEDVRYEVAGAREEYGA